MDEENKQFIMVDFPMGIWTEKVENTDQRKEEKQSELESEQEQQEEILQQKDK